MQFIDTHIHLQDFKSKCATDIISESQAAGVKKFICVSSFEQDWPLAAALAETYPDLVVPAFGLHPWYAGKAASGWEERLQHYMQAFPQALIGECGLDRVKNPEFEGQAEVFKKQIALAENFGRPLIIHAVKAADWLESFWTLLPEKFVFHSFGGSQETAAKVLKHGGCLGFNFSILRSRHKNKVLRSVPSGKILLETDGPYQGPEKGQEVTSAALPQLLSQIAAVRDIEPQVLAEQVYRNSSEFIEVGK